ncbi:MAG: carbon starvation CstA family protein [Eubacteriales bacterium]|nr:carbon starvation CstA family protein [Eubacteriales bacterium]
MSALLILLAAIILLGLGYVFYGGWLAKQWGVDPNRETPAHTAYDGKDFVPANPAVLMGHHFSSIAGAGPINGPILASVFGWVPVFLWCVLGGIFFGAMHDFGALFASIRHNGGSIGEVIKDSMGVKAQRLFIIFALAVLILVIASFTAVVAGTFASSGPFISTGDQAGNPANASTAMTSILFIVIACIFGFFVYRKNAPVGPATIVGIIGIIAIVVIGQFLNLNAGRTFWVLFIAVYVTVASLLPVWILLQPRDYLSSFLLYGMMILAFISIIGGTFTGAATVEIPAVVPAKASTIFPTLFITVACGACSGFHSLISSGTSSKQIDNEKDAQVIGYGSMIIESVLGVISLIAVGVVFTQAAQGGGDRFTAPPAAFAGGIATMFSSFAGEKSFAVIYNLFTLAVSVFALTSLDSATRLCRYLFAELLTPEGKTHEDLTGAAKFFSTPIVSTLIMVIIGCGMGFLNLNQIWGVFGAANQLLAGIAMLAVCTWLGKIGKNNKMFYFPMCFMLVATITYLVMTIIGKIKVIGGGAAAWGDWYVAIWSTALVVLAAVLAVTAVKTLAAQAKAKKA